MVACIYIPQFPAWAMYRCARPERPVVVIHRGAVVAASPRAVKMGVVAGMAVGRATALVPGAQISVRDRALEAAAWEEALEGALDLTPYVESTEAGWAYVRDAAPSDLAALARRLGARVGIAPARSLARIAAVRAAPRYVLPVDSADVTAFLSQTSTDVLRHLGFEREVPERLPLLGLPTLQSVRGLTRRHLVAQFGEEGAALYALLHPPADEPPVSAFAPPPTLRSRTDLDDDVREPGEILPLVHGLAREVAAALGPFLCRRMTVRLWTRGDERPRSAGRVITDATQDAKQLERLAESLALNLLGEDTWVQGAAVELAGLTRGASEQAALWRARPSARMAARGVHRRFPGAIRRAMVVTDALFHEDAVRWEPFPDELINPPLRRAS